MKVSEAGCALGGTEGERDSCEAKESGKRSRHRGDTSLRERWDGDGCDVVSDAGKHRKRTVKKTTDDMNQERQ